MTDLSQQPHPSPTLREWLESAPIQKIIDGKTLRYQVINADEGLALLDDLEDERQRRTNTFRMWEECAAKYVEACDERDALRDALTPDERVAVEAATWVTRAEQACDHLRSALGTLAARYEALSRNESGRYVRAQDVAAALRDALDGSK